ncbi:hypothetical protein [Haladaptatus sp. NG-WS-4]
MAGVLEPLSVLVGTTLAIYCLWQLAFDPLHGPLPGKILPFVVLFAGALVGIGLLYWGFDRLDLLRRP